MDQDEDEAEARPDTRIFTNCSAASSQAGKNPVGVMTGMTVKRKIRVMTDRAGSDSDRVSHATAAQYRA